MTDPIQAKLDSVAEALRLLTEKQAETDRLFKENERRMAETDRLFKENERRQEERARQRVEEEIRLRRLYEEYLIQSEKTDRSIEKVSATLGSWANNQGDFAEEYFFNSFERGKRNFFGEKFKDIRKNVKGLENDDEYDILLINGKSIGIVETKYKAHKKDIPKVLKKAETFRINFPMYANHKVFLGLATMAFHPGLEQLCKEKGIAVIKQVGDSVVIYDEHLKVY